MPIYPPVAIRALGLGALCLTLSACADGFDFDMRGLADGFTTKPAVSELRTSARPEPDARGVISYPTYQVAVAQRGDTVADLAARVGLPAAELGRHNGLPVDAALRKGELVALPRRVAEPPTGPIQPDDQQIDITTLAGDAIERADTAGPARTSAPAAQSGEEPSRHQVKRGETAYSVARLYGVSVRALADWNGLGTDLAVREGQHLLIPVALPDQPAAQPVSQPGQGSATPTPPSAAQPLPNETAAPLSASATPPSPNLGDQATAASAAAMMLPVQGRITRDFEKGTTDGIDISASAGTAVKAAADGTVAAITRNTDGVPILVIRHPNNVLTVYANIDGLAVKKGDKVKRGQKVATVRAGSPAFLHFQVREGTVAVDPDEYLN